MKKNIKRKGKIRLYRKPQQLKGKGDKLDPYRPEFFQPCRLSVNSRRKFARGAQNKGKEKGNQHRRKGPYVFVDAEPEYKEKSAAKEVVNTFIRVSLSAGGYS